MSTYVLIIIAVLLGCVIGCCLWVMSNGSRFSQSVVLVAGGMLIACLMGFLILLVSSPFYNKDKTYVYDSDGECYEVIEIEGSPYLKGRFGTISPYIHTVKE